MIEPTDFRTRQRQLREAMEAPGVYDWKITFHKKNSTKKEQSTLHPIYLLKEKKSEVARRLWRAENLTGNRQAHLECKAWRFEGARGWIEYPKDILMREA